MKRIIGLCAASVIVLGCGSLKIKESVPLNDEESSVLSAEVQSIGFGYSYDYDVAVWGIFNNFGVDLIAGEFKKSEDTKKITEILAKTDPKVIISLYEKIYRNYYSLLYVRDYYTKKKQWKFANYINKTLLPSTEYFIYLSEQSLAVKYPEIKKSLDNRRPALHRQAINDTIERLSIVDGFN